MDDSDSDEEPDAVMHVPLNKVKLVVGPGGDKIKYIQRKSKCRLQVGGGLILARMRCIE